MNSMFQIINQFNLKQKLILLVSIPIIGLILASGFSLHQKQKLFEITQKQITHETSQLLLFRELSSLFNQTSVSLMNVVLVDDLIEFETNKKSILENKNLLFSKSKELSTLFKIQRDIDAVNAIVKALESYAPVAQKVLADSEAGEVQAAALTLTTEVPPIRQVISEQFNLLQNYSKEDINLALQNAQQATINSIIVTAGVTFVLIIICLIIATIITKSLVNQIGGEPSDAMVTLQRMAGGDLAFQVKTAPKGSLMHSLKVFHEKVRDTLNETIKAVDTVNTSSSTVVSISSELTHSANTQSQTTLTTASNIEQMSASAQSVSEYANQTKTQAQNSSQLANEGKFLMQNLVNQMKTMSEDMNTSVNEISELVSFSDKIKGIVSVIEGIAEQTNLLALNAAIEAARAGEEGRGFAVVADEVRKLAGNTASATQEIKTLINQICNRSECSRDTVSKANHHVQTSVESAIKLQNDLSTIVDNLNQSVAHTEAVASSTAEQLMASQDIASKMASAAELADALNQASNNLSTQAKNMLKQSEQLKKTVGFFST